MQGYSYKNYYIASQGNDIMNKCEFIWNFVQLYTSWHMIFVHAYAVIYILKFTQLPILAPTSETINAFWQMIIENKPIFVVMVTKFIENGKVRNHTSILSINVTFHAKMPLFTWKVINA